jgi:RES domain
LIPIRQPRQTAAARWAPPPRGDASVSVLYTSLERDGAIVEVVSFLAELNPVPGPRPIKVTRLAATASKTLRLARADLETLGVDIARYGERDYSRTQEIGAALEFLELDGLLAPSARWPCENLMLFTLNHAVGERLEAQGTEQIEWRAWAQAHGLLQSDPPGSAAVVRLNPRRRR